MSKVRAQTPGPKKEEGDLKVGEQMQEEKDGRKEGPATPELDVGEGGGGACGEEMKTGVRERRKKMDEVLGN